MIIGVLVAHPRQFTSINCQYYYLGLIKYVTSWRPETLLKSITDTEDALVPYAVFKR